MPALTDDPADVDREVESILAAVDSWRILSYRADRKYAELLRHFNGGPLEVDVSHGEREFAANFNIARSRLKKISRERMQGWFSKLGIFSVTLTGAELSGTSGLELAANEALSRILRSDLRMAPHYKSCVEDAILTGRGVMWRKDPMQIIPERGRMMTHPDGISSQRDDSFAEWGFASTVKAGDLFRIARKTNDPAIKDQAEKLLRAILRRHSTMVTPLQFPLHEPWEIYDETLACSILGRKALATVIPCYWYFEKDLSGPPSKRPVSVYCVARHGVDLSLVADDNGKVSHNVVRGPQAEEGLIYKSVDAFPGGSGDCLWLFTIGEQFGGEPTMERIKGEGEIQYSSDVRIQKILNSLLRRIEVENLVLFERVGQVSAKALDDLSKQPLRENDVLPEGVRFVERRFGDKPISNMMQFVSLLSGYGADHAAVDTGHTDAPREEDFKDQVLERLQDRTTAKSITDSAWTDCLDMMAQSIGYLLFDATLTSSDDAWEFRERFIQELKDVGYEFVDFKKEWAKKAKVTARNNPGHGDIAVALARADMNLQLAERTSPEAVAKAVFEKAVLVNGGDVAKAIAMFGQPGGPPPPSGMDVYHAQMQTATILATGANIPPQPGDNPFIHTAVHMTLLESALAGYQADKGWSPDDKRKWDAAFAHGVQDVSRMPNPDAKKDAMKRIKEIFQAASQLPVFENGPPPVDPIQQAKIELAAAELDRKRQKDEAADAKWERTQMHREERDAEMMALQTHQALSSGVRLDREQTGKQASRQLNDALALNAATNGMDDEESEEDDD